MSTNAVSSVLGAALEASRRGRYATASKNPSQTIDLADTTRYPLVSDAEVSAMAASIAPALCSIFCYDIMGASTQVVVVEENSPLTIPFIAAQETQVSTCFVWSSERRRYTGVLSITEYVKVLLYCEANPQEVERISNLTVKEWLELKRAQGLVGAGGQSVSSPAPEALVSATADESLAVCIERMLANKVRRLAIVADDTDESRYETSILTVVTFDILMQNVANRLFSTDIFGASLQRNSQGGVAGGSGGLPPSVQSIVDGGEGGHEEDGLEGVLGEAVGSITGAYRTIFDVPYARLSRLGKAAQHKAAHGSYPTPEVVFASAPIATALSTLIDKALHTVAVVDSNNPSTVIDAVTRNDAIRMETGGVFNLQIPVREALAHTNGGLRPAVAVFHETDTLREIIEHFATRRVPVLFLVNPNTDALMAQLSISEVFSFLSECSS